MDVEQAYVDALETALASVILDAERQVQTYQLQSDAIIAKADAKIEEAKYRIAEMEREAERRIEKRLASVRDGKDGKDVDMGEVGILIEGAVAALPRPENGKDADLEVVEKIVEEKISAISFPEDYKEADVNLLDGMMELAGRMISDRIAELPNFEEAQSGLIAEKVSEAIAELPTPKDGKDADPEIIREMIAAAVAEIPLPKDGKDADPEVIREMISDIISQTPLPKDGKDADPAEVVPLVLAELPSAEELRGPPGQLPVVSRWEEGVYYEGDVVVFHGGTYQAKKDTGRSPETEDWACLASPGEPGTGYVWRGTFSSDKSYNARDIVQCNGSSWCARQNNPGACPGDGWHLWASRGGKGDKGARGERGLPGPAGATMVGVELDGQGVLSFRLSDDRKMDVDLYDLLSRLK